MYRILLIPLILAMVGCSLNPQFTTALNDCDKQAIKIQIKKSNDINYSSSDTGWRPIHCAVRMKDLEFTRWLIDNGADIKATTKKSATPLFFSAVSDNTIEITKLLIKKGADVNAKSRRGGTPLLASARFGANKTAILLVTHGAEVNYKDPIRGISAPMWAKYKKNEKLVTFFNSITPKINE